MVGKDLIMATLFGSGGGSSGSGGGEGEKSPLDAMIDGSITEISNDSVEKIAKYAFYSRTALTKVKFDKVRSLLKEAFAFCSALEIVDLAVAIYFDANVFQSCSKLKALVLRNTAETNYSNKVAYLYSNQVFQNVSNDFRIYVPAVLLDSYKTATNWTTLADKFRALEDYTVDGTIMGDLDPTKI